MESGDPSRGGTLAFLILNKTEGEGGFAMGIFSKLFGTKKQNEEIVVCGKCKKNTKVKYYGSASEGGGKKKIVLVGPNEIKQMQKDNIALRCQDCGFIVCYSCATSKIGDVGMPTCPSCGKEGGPYLFMR